VLVPVFISIYINSLVSNPTMANFARVCSALITAIIVCECSRKLVYNSRRWFTMYRSGLIAFLAGLLLTAVALALHTVVKEYIRTGELNFSFMNDSAIMINENRLRIGLIGFSLMNALFVFPFLFGSYEFFYHSAQLRFTKERSEKLEQEKVRAELQQLKGIVNPHFLFNNLNSLSSLMTEDVQQAQDFLDELTKVFRYLLRNHETDLTTLQEELHFIQSYYHLLQTRHGNGIDMTVHIDEQHQDKLIPPLTLQLLIENAVKHNQLTKASPLKIKLFSSGNNKLVVQNNIQPKKAIIESTGIGLQNIKSRYRMLNKPGIEIQKGDHTFSVSIQLIDTAS
jgi:two-component system LytT family sensor kinase